MKQGLLPYGSGVRGEGDMHNPVMDVVALARQFMSSAILIEESFPWVAGINASFSIELFIKSYLLQENWEDDPDWSDFSSVFTMQKRILEVKDKSNFGHDLNVLFNMLPDSVRDEVERSVDKFIIRNVPEFLGAYGNIFKKSRYVYEKGDGNVVPFTALIHLAKVFDCQVQDVNK